ncbi:MAG TPA: tRNA 2-selenouridine(34) synthase MnmH, partial [Bacteroidia bacterium]|nr:tRNA 2-selenouridine(34) synthase MnmH [Bacteroidia bacterium]
PVFRIKVPFETRVQRLVNDYGKFPAAVLAEATARIRKRLGGLATKQALEAIGNGQLDETVRITLRYYDRAYDHPHKERNYSNVFFIETDSGDPAHNAELILEEARRQKNTLS